MSYFTWNMKSEVLDDYAAQGLCSNCYKPIEYRLSDECPDCVSTEDDEFPNDDEIEIWGKYEKG